jgi:hypothetical protein
MPRGGGLIYDYPVLREAILEFLVDLEMGDIFDGRDLVTHLSTYRGLSRKHKNNVYSFKERILVRSKTFFVQVANQIIEKDELPIVRTKWLKRFREAKTVLGHDCPTGLTGTPTLYEHTGH